MNDAAVSDASGQGLTGVTASSRTFCSCVERHDRSELLYFLQRRTSERLCRNDGALYIQPDRSVSRSAAQYRDLQFSPVPCPSYQRDNEETYFYELISSTASAGDRRRDQRWSNSSLAFFWCFLFIYAIDWNSHDWCTAITSWRARLEKRLVTPWFTAAKVALAATASDSSRPK